MAYRLMSTGCCLWWATVDPIILPGSYIAWDSAYNELQNPYKPYVTYNDQTNFYVPYNYDPMAPILTKFAEIDEAPVLQAMDYFIGVSESGHDYRFTPGQLLVYIQSQSRTTYTVSTVDPDGVSVVTIPGLLPNVQSIQSTNSVIIEGNDFTQSGTTITRIDGGAWGDTQKLVLFY